MIGHVCAGCGSLVAEYHEPSGGLECCAQCSVQRSSSARFAEADSLAAHEQPLRAAVAELAATWEREGARHVASKLRELLGRVE